MHLKKLNSSGGMVGTEIWPMQKPATLVVPNRAGKLFATFMASQKRMNSKNDPQKWIKPEIQEAKP